jgi:hypothetical protein
MRKERAALVMAALLVGCGDNVTAPLSAGAIAPHSGQTTGGTAVTIYGTGFVTGATVTVAGMAATNVKWIGPSFITATSPAHAAGAADVVVTNPDGHTASIAGGFIYADLAGSWSGKTSQGQAISFTVDSTNSITALSYGFDLPNGCTSGFGFGGGSIDVSSLAFSYSSTVGSINGTFNSNSSASGSITVASATGCVGSVAATWTATKN